jgi:hypothetical protein
MRADAFTLVSDHLPHPLRRNAHHALVAFAVFMTMVALSNGPLKASILDWQEEGREEIAAEHEGPASLILDVSTRSGRAIVEAGNDGSGPLLLSVPETWRRREVRGATLDEVAPAETGLGFVRYVIPTGATLSLSADTSATHMTLHHPSADPLKIRLTRVDLDRDTVTRDVVLVQGQQVELW